MREYGIRNGVDFGTAPNWAQNKWRAEHCKIDSDVVSGTCSEGKLALT